MVFRKVKSSFGESETVARGRFFFTEKRARKTGRARGVAGPSGFRVGNVVCYAISNGVPHGTPPSHTVTSDAGEVLVRYW